MQVLGSTTAIRQHCSSPQVLRMQHETSIQHGLNQFIIAAATTSSKLATDNMLGLAF
jgi:hypothetical protein